MPYVSYVKYKGTIIGSHNDDGKSFPWRGREKEDFSKTRYDYDRKLLYGNNNYIAMYIIVIY